MNRILLALVVALGASLYTSSAFALPRGGDYQEITVPVPPFNKVCRIFATPRVRAAWDESDVLRFQRAVIDQDPDTDRDLFGRVWEYLCHGDRDPRFDAIEVQLNGRGPVVHTIDFYLYHQKDVTQAYYPTIMQPNRVIMNVNHGTRVLDPEEVVFGKVLAHEFAHLIFRYNHPGAASSNGWADEFAAVAAEYLVGFRWPDPSPYNVYYDTSFLTNRRYDMARLFHAYLMRHYQGEPGRDDDVLYQWVRPSAKYGVNYQMAGLGVALDSLSTAHPERYPVDPALSMDEKVGRLFHEFNLARYANENLAFGGRYGFGEDVDVNNFRMFAWPDTNGEFVRSVPPQVSIDTGRLSSSSLTRYVGTQGGMSEACRRRTIGVRPWSAEYIVLHANEETAGKHLRLEVGLPGGLPQGKRLYVGALLYSERDSSLASVTPFAVVPFAEGLELPVANFGSEIGSVVLVISLASNPLLRTERSCPDPFCGPYSANPCEDCDAGRGACREPQVPLEVRYSVRP